jgi:hypothetical protein
MQTAWKARPNAKPLGSVAPGVREKTPPITDAIQIKPTRRNTIPPTRSTIFILFSLGSERLDDEPERKNRRNAVKAVPEERAAAQRAVLAAEHVRHHRDNSGERNQPRDQRTNPPQHFRPPLVFCFSAYRYSENAKSAPCVMRVTATLCVNVRNVPRAPFTLARYSRACSSDQKKTDLCQKASMILGSFNVSKLTSGAKTSGSVSGSMDLIVKSLSISRRSGWRQCAHSVSM